MLHLFILSVCVHYQTVQVATTRRTSRACWCGVPTVSSLTPCVSWTHTHTHTASLIDTCRLKRSRLYALHLSPLHLVCPFPTFLSLPLSYLLNPLFVSILVDEYILMAKEKHGYNIEQVQQSTNEMIFNFSLPFTVRFRTGLFSWTCDLISVSCVPSGSRHVIMAQTRCGTLTCRSGQLHTLPR